MRSAIKEGTSRGREGKQDTVNALPHKCTCVDSVRLIVDYSVFFARVQPRRNTKRVSLPSHWVFPVHDAPKSHHFKCLALETTLRNKQNWILVQRQLSTLKRLLREPSPCSYCSAALFPELENRI